MTAPAPAEAASVQVRHRYIQRCVGDGIVDQDKLITNEIHHRLVGWCVGIGILDKVGPFVKDDDHGIGSRNLQIQTRSDEDSVSIEILSLVVFHIGQDVCETH